VDAKGSRLVVVEDDALIAESLREELGDAGFDVVGVAYRLDSALALIAGTEFDAVLMDANLAGVSAGSLATSLRERGIPFVVLSGYAREQIAREFPGATFVQKPYQLSQLIDGLTAILSRLDCGAEKRIGAAQR
jgi:DNA-binding response OmpR family regulator